MEDLIRQIETIDASKVDALVLRLNCKLTPPRQFHVERWWQMKVAGTPLSNKSLIILGEGESLTVIESRTVNEARASDGLPPIPDGCRGSFNDLSPLSDEKPPHLDPQVLGAFAERHLAYLDAKMTGNPTALQSEMQPAKVADDCTCENLFLGARNCPACLRKRGEE